MLFFPIIQTYTSFFTSKIRNLSDHFLQNQEDKTYYHLSEVVKFGHRNFVQFKNCRTILNITAKEWPQNQMVAVVSSVVVVIFLCTVVAVWFITKRR
jgi:ABC-type sugar transport system permease subunit